VTPDNGERPDVPFPGALTGRTIETKEGPPSVTSRLSEVSSVSMAGRDVSMAGPREANATVDVADGDVTAARARALGIDVPLGDPFNFRLFGRWERATLHPTERGHWIYRSDSGEFGLGELRGLLAYGAPRRISDLEQARWMERLDWRAGVIDRSPLVLPVPDGTSSEGRRLAIGISLLLGLRDPGRWPLDEPFTYARRFRMAYCGVSNGVSRRGMEDLERGGVVVLAGRAGRGALAPMIWRLSGTERADEVISW
jgi:hypothetical protein